jgi:hypothetical protein
MPLDENAAIARVREVIGAYSRQDFDAVVARISPEFELVRIGVLPDVRGADALRAWMEPDAFESQVIEPVEIQAAGEKVLVHQHHRIRGAGSGLETDFLAWTVWTFDDEGRLLRLEVFLDHEEDAARAAAGLAAQE